MRHIVPWAMVDLLTTSASAATSFAVAFATASSNCVRFATTTGRSVDCPGSGPDVEAGVVC